MSFYCSGQEVEAETWYTVLELVSPFNTTLELSHTAYRLYYTVTNPLPLSLSRESRPLSLIATRLSLHYVATSTEKCCDAEKESYVRERHAHRNVASKKACDFYNWAGPSAVVFTHQANRSMVRLEADRDHLSDWVSV